MRLKSETAFRPPLPRDVSVLLRAEGAAVAALAILAYSGTGAGWWLFLALALLPDLSMAGYLAGPKTGARCYNAAHTYLAPAAAWLILQPLAPQLALPIALVWATHIGFDRMLGYGLKYQDAFTRTHLSVIGSGRARGEAGTA